MVDLVIADASIVTPEGVVRGHLTINGGKIVEISQSVAPSSVRQRIDAVEGEEVYPAGIDPHVHFNEPGRTHWEGIATGSAALVAGGGTGYIDMPLNSHPPTLTRDDVAAKHAAMSAGSYADYACWGGLTPDHVADLDGLADAGVVGFKAFLCDSGIAEFAAADPRTLRDGMCVARRRGLVVAVHAEDESVTRPLTRRAVTEGRTGWRDFAASRPIEAEVRAIRLACELAGETGAALHVVHVSSAAGVDEVTRARHAGVDVTCETCPHYLLLTEDDMVRIGANAKCAPPLRPSGEVAALRRRLAAGDIHWVASDHSPAPPPMKVFASDAGDTFALWGGIAGVQATLAATRTVASSADTPLPATHVARLTSGAAAERFRILDKGAIRVGYDADLAIVDTRRPYVVSGDDLLDRYRASPYVGRTFVGRTVRTILRGRTVAVDGRVIGPPGGRALRTAGPDDRRAAS